MKMWLFKGKYTVQSRDPNVGVYLSENQFCVHSPDFCGLGNKEVPKTRNKDLEIFMNEI